MESIADVHVTEPAVRIRLQVNTDNYIAHLCSGEIQCYNMNVKLGLSGMECILFAEVLTFSLKWAHTIYCVIHPQEKAPQHFY